MLKRMSCLLALLMASTTVLAQYDNPRGGGGDQAPYGSRDGRFESSAVAGFQNGADKIFTGGSQLDVDSEFGWGFSLGWNWTQNLNLSYRLLFSEPGYAATIVPEDDVINRRTIENSMSKYSHQFNLTYHFRDEGFTPLATVGVGVASVDSNVPNGALDAGCWWDPWWGYVCLADWETYSSTELAYNVGLGFRWDINNAIYTRGTYSLEFIDLDSGTLDFGTFLLELGLMF
jgi:opacity protein-like surface antigen